MRGFNLLMTITVAALTQACATAGASELFGVVNGSDGFFKINQNTGTATLVGGTSLYSPRDMASDTRPGSFRMWVPDGQDQLFTVNPATGSTTLVGHFGFNPNMDWIDALAFDPSTDTLFGVSNLNVLYSINQATGAATVIASTHHFSPFSALACDNSGTLFGETGDDIMGRPALVEINKTTGAITVRAHLATDVNDIAVRPEDNVMFGTMPGSAGNASLYTINPTTGAMTFVGRTGAGVTGVSGLAFSALPEPVSSSALALAGVALMRRRSLRRR